MSSDRFLTLTAIGLVYDVVGVLILGWALACTRTQTVFRQSVLAWKDRLTFRVLMLQRFDAQFGLGFLVVGFLGQLLATVGIAPVGATAWSLYGLIPLLLMAYILARRTRGRITDAKFDRLSNESDRSSNRN